MLITRLHREADELNRLAPYATHSANTRGRRFPEAEDEYRTPFQKDRDRILHTTAFRRLEYKTQVFVNYEGDYYRTRLTHTLEVAQIGRSLAQTLGANVDLVEGICLAHDLGHSPFGHSGETILDALMQGHGGFNHNHQTYRIITELEERYPGWSGLNLTHEMLEGVAKHETRYDLSTIKGFDPQLRGSLEAQLANLADEMAYNAHDLDDGLRSGLLTADQLRGLTIWQQVAESIGWDRQTAQAAQVYDDMVRHRMIRRLIGLAIDDVVAATHQQLVATQAQTVLAIQRLPAPIATYSAPFGAAIEALKTFLFDQLYQHYRVVRMSTKAQKFVADLFGAYTQQPKQLAPAVYSRLASVGLHRAVADYIAGMTDRFALQEWERLFDPFTRP